MTFLYSCFGFRLGTDFPLPELAPAEDPGDARPIVPVRKETLPELLPGGREAEHNLQIAGDAVMLSIANAGRYLMRGGGEILFDPAGADSERRTRLFLLGSALGILCHQRGLLPLHANAIVSNGGAVAFAGSSGAGKSTLAAWFARAGHEVLCDDVCVIGFEDGRPFAWPGLPRLKLWGDAAATFGHDSDTLDPVVEGLDKYQVPLGPGGPVRPIPFRRLYVLSRSEEGRDGTVERLQGRAAMAAVMAQTYRGLYLRPLGLATRHFQLAAALLGHAEIYAASRAWGFDVFGREADRLERHFAGHDGF